MDQSNALRNLLDSADILTMLEELITHSAGRLSPSAIAGLKVSLKSARDTVLSSHDSLAQNFVQKAQKVPVEGASAQTSTPAAAPSFQRKDLRASLERIIENR